MVIYVLTQLFFFLLLVLGIVVLVIALGALILFVIGAILQAKDPKGGK